MNGSLTAPSAQLLEANRQLHALREQIKSQCQLTESAGSRVRCSGDLPWNADADSSDRLPVDLPTTLPRHLGWGSAALTAVLRRQQWSSGFVDDDQAWINSLQEEFKPSLIKSEPTSDQTELSLTTNFPSSGAVKLYPDIGLGMLRQEMTAPGRLWLMLRYLDEEGRGVIRIDIITRTLAKKSSKLRLCGQRQLRNLLNDGEGIFWNRDNDCVWLNSAARVAYALNVEGLTGQPVALPVAAMVEGIGAFRAHLYAAFHSGRTKDTPHGEQAMPIARDTLAGLSGVGRSSQRTYEERVGLQVQANFAIGHLATKENQEKQAWHQGQALFELKDYRGQQGKKGKTYLAWQLPNTYIGQHQHRPKGRQKRINRKLKDLVMKGMPGNVEGTDETRKSEKMYFPNGKLAAKTCGRNSEQDLYWKRHRTRNGRFELWQQLGGR